MVAAFWIDLAMMDVKICVSVRRLRSDAGDKADEAREEAEEEGDSTLLAPAAPAPAAELSAADGFN